MVLFLQEAPPTVGIMSYYSLNYVYELLPIIRAQHSSQCWARIIIRAYYNRQQFIHVIITCNVSYNNSLWAHYSSYSAYTTGYTYRYNLGVYIKIVPMILYNNNYILVNILKLGWHWPLHYLSTSPHQVDSLHLHVPWIQWQKDHESVDWLKGFSPKLALCLSLFLKYRPRTSSQRTWPIPWQRCLHLNWIRK